MGLNHNKDLRMRKFMSLIAAGMLFIALGATSANAEGMKCGAGKCGDAPKPMTKKCGAKKEQKKCGAAKAAKKCGSSKKCGSEKKAEKKCGEG